MGYYIDLSEITINQYKNKLATAYLPPSRLILREQRDERFGFFEQLGLSNIQELHTYLRNKKKLEALKKEACFAGDYLKILLRELNSILPKPNKITDFTSLKPEIPVKLEKKGIKNTRKLYEHVKAKELRHKLAEETGIDSAEVMKLTKFTDLSRIKWAGAAFVQMLYHIGVDTVEKVAQSNPETLHQKINQYNKNMQIYKGKIGFNDIAIFVDAAREVPLEIEY